MVEKRGRHNLLKGETELTGVASKRVGHGRGSAEKFRIQLSRREIAIKDDGKWQCRGLTELTEE